MKKIAVFASGFGSNFQAIIEAVKQQTLNAEIALLVSDNPSCKAVERASAAGIDAFTFCARDYENKAAYEQAVLAELRERQIDYIVLAGYMRIIGLTLLEAYPMRIINLHPALLPSFPGAHGIADAYHYGYSDGNSDCDTDRNPDRYTHGNADTDEYAKAYGNADNKADTDEYRKSLA